MGIRIQPRGIEVPEDDPFKNDLLDRQEAVEVLTHLVGNIEGPCVLAVDADWGAGKTTFLRIWSQHLRNGGFPLVEFNAWETDFSEDPFVTLSIKLTEGLRECAGEPLGGKIDAINEAAKDVLRRVAPGAIRLAAAALPIVGVELGKVFSAYAEEKLSQHQKAGEAVGKFTDVLQDAANTLSEERVGRPLILMIDELDRCRPSYAVELLEMAKHLFSVDHIVFVLAVNRDQLAHSVKALYGSDFDAEGYLRRFFDVDFQLPEPSRDAFIAAQLRATGIADYFDQTPLCRAMLLAFFGASDLSLRTIGQAIHRLGLLYASLQRDQHDYGLATTVALILRTLDQGLYDRFVNGEDSDLDVVDAVFGRPGLQDIRHEQLGAEFEALIVLAAQEDEKISILSSSEPINSPLLGRYAQLRKKADPDLAPLRINNQPQRTTTGETASKDPHRQHAEDVLHKVDEFRKSFGITNSGIGFRNSVQRIELLSATLIEKQVEAT